LAQRILSTCWKILIFYETQFWSFFETIWLPSSRFPKKNWKYHQNCLTKRPKLSFIKN
jgi:hypothetical protein